MSKRRKRKPSRRERRAGVDRPTKHPVEADEAPVDAPSESAVPDQPKEASETAPERPAVTATFQPTTKSEQTVSLEQRYIGRDLRRLGIQMGIFVAIIVALAVLDAQTDLISNLGSSLFTLWE